MKPIIILVSFVICSLFLNICKAQWAQTLAYGTITSLAANDNRIFAASTNPHIYYSTYGTGWTQDNLSLHYGSFLSLAANGDYVFAGHTQYGVLRSTDNGVNWTYPLLNQNVASLAANGSNIFAGTVGNGIYSSSNYGANWTQTPLNNQIVNSLAAIGSNVFAGTQNSGVYLSTNNGVIWIQTSLNNQIIRALVVNGSNIFVGTNAGVYLSTNSGVSWVQTSLNNHDISSLAVDGNDVFAGTSDITSFYVSNNNGTSWTQRSEGLGNLFVYALCVYNDYIYGGTNGNGIYRRPLSELLGIQPISGEIPKHYALEQNYPNPFNVSTKFKVQIPKLGHAELVVYDVRGKEVAILVNEELNPGIYEVQWDAGDFPSGVYFYKLVSGDYSETKRMVLVK